MMPIENPNAFPGATNALCPGMTLRDWFAGQAMAGVAPFLLSLAESGKASAIGGGPVSATSIAAAMFEFADAMLAARATQDRT